MTTAITDTTGLERQLTTFAQGTAALQAQSARLQGEISDAEAGIREKRKAIFENEVTMEANARKSAAVTELIRSFHDADTARARALEDFHGV